MTKILINGIIQLMITKKDLDGANVTTKDDLGRVETRLDGVETRLGGVEEELKIVNRKMEFSCFCYSVDEN